MALANSARLRGALFLAAAAGVVAAASFAATAPDPKGLVLRAGDSDAFAMAATTRVPFAKAGRGKPPGWRQNLERWGYLDGFVAEFRDRISDRALVSQAVVFRNANGARAYLAAIFRSPPAPRGLRRLRHGTRLGQETRLYVLYATHSGVRTETYFLAWRNRNVFAGVTLGQRRGKLNTEEVRFLGETQNERIERALGP